MRLLLNRGIIRKINNDMDQNPPTQLGCVEPVFSSNEYCCDLLVATLTFEQSAFDSSGECAVHSRNARSGSLRSHLRRATPPRAARSDDGARLLISTVQQQLRAAYDHSP
jgi:hypothetical protein